jgi:hypothetical protein
MSKRYSTVLLPFLIGALLIAGAGGVAFADDHNSAIPEAQVIDGEDGIDVWERAVLPLRVEYDDAAVAVPNALFDIDPPNEGPIPLNYDTVGVFDTGAPITAEFEERTGADALPNEELTFVLLRLNDSVADTGTILTDPSLSTLNEAGEYTAVGTVTTDQRGRADVSFTPTESGQYLLLAATDDGAGGLTVTDGELDVDGNATIVGLDFAVVQAGDATVDAATARVSAGSNATFEVESGFAPTEADDAAETTTAELSEIQHTIVLYDERTYVDQRFVISLDDDIAEAESLSANTTIQSTIAEVDGTLYTRGEPQIGTLALENDTGPLAFEGLVASIQAALDQEQFPEAESVGDTTLYASASVVDNATSPTIAVGSTTDWRPGPYRYVYVASQDGQIRTTTGRLVVLPPQARGGDDSPGRGDGDSPGRSAIQRAPTVDATIIQSGHAPIPLSR